MLKQFRCNKCNKLLAKISNYSELEIKCNRCKQLNYHSYSLDNENQHDAKQKPFILANALPNDQ